MVDVAVWANPSAALKAAVAHFAYRFLSRYSVRIFYSIRFIISLIESLSWTRTAPSQRPSRLWRGTFSFSRKPCATRAPLCFHTSIKPFITFSLLCMIPYLEIFWQRSSVRASPSRQTRRSHRRPSSSSAASSRLPRELIPQIIEVTPPPRGLRSL